MEDENNVEEIKARIVKSDGFARAKLNNFIKIKVKSWKGELQICRTIFAIVTYACVTGDE